jgi:hypothetical protein
VDFIVQRWLALKNHSIVDADIFFPNQPEAAFVFVSQWEQSSDNKKCEK